MPKEISVLESQRPMQSGSLMQPPTINTNDNQYALWAGEKAVDAPIKQLQSAQTMTDAYPNQYDMPGQDFRYGGAWKDVYAKTGSFVGPEGKPRWEIDDSRAKLMTNQIPRNSTVKLNSMLKHDLLFKNYPQLNNLNVTFINDARPNAPYGYFDSPNNNIVMNTAYMGDTLSDNDLSLLLHELQHGIQELEDFAKGSNASSDQLYWKSYGEQEARDVQDRMNMISDYQGNPMYLPNRRTIPPFRGRSKDFVLDLETIRSIEAKKEYEKMVSDLIENEKNESEAIRYK